MITSQITGIATFEKRTVLESKPIMVLYTALDFFTVSKLESLAKSHILEVLNKKKSKLLVYARRLATSSDLQRREILPRFHEINIFSGRCVVFTVYDCTLYAAAMQR